MLDPSYRRPPPVEHGYGPIDRSFSPYQSTHPSIGSQWQPQSGAHYQDSYQNSLQDRGYTPPPGQPPTSDQNYSNAGYTDYDGEEEEEEMDVEGYYDGQDDFDYHGPGRHSPPQPTVPLYSAEETPRPPKSSFAKGFMRGLKNFPKTVFRYGDRKKAVAPAPQPTGYVLDDPPVNSQFPMTSTPPETIPVSLQPHGGFEFPQTQHIYSERPPPISEESYTSALQEGPDPRRVGPDVVVTGPSGHLEQVPEEPANFRESPPPPMPVPQVQDTITSIPYNNTQTQTQTPGPHLSILPSQTTEMPMPMIQSPLLEPPQSQRPAAPPDRDPVPARDGSTTIPEPVTPARSTYYKRSRRDDTSYRSSGYPSTYNTIHQLNPVLKFFQKLAEMPWVSRTRVTSDYRPPSRKGGRSRWTIDNKISGKDCWYSTSRVDITESPREPSPSSAATPRARRHSYSGHRPHHHHHHSHSHSHHRSRSRQTSTGHRSSRRRRANTISSSDDRPPPVPPLPGYYAQYGYPYYPYGYPPPPPPPGHQPGHQRAGSNVPTPRPSRSGHTSNPSNATSTHHSSQPIPPVPPLPPMAIIPVAASPPGAGPTRYTPQPLSPPGAYPVYVVPTSDPALSGSGSGSSGNPGQPMIGWMHVPLGVDTSGGLNVSGGGITFPQPQHVQMTTPPMPARMGSGTQVDGNP